MKSYTNCSAAFLSVVMLFVLSACGGGGGGGDNNNEPPVDEAAPTISINKPVDVDTYTTGSNSISIAGISTDNVGVTEISWSNDSGGSGTAVGTTDWSYTGLSLQPGTNIITVTARDAANNTDSDIITVIYDVNFVDNEAPAITITAPSADPNYTANGNTINIAGTASDNVGVTEITWSNAAGGTGSVIGVTDWSYNGLQLSPGTNVITVTARDAANNTASDVITVTYAVNDNVNPQISVTSPAQNGQYTTDVNRVSIAGTTSDNIGVTRVAWSSSRGDSGDAIGTNPWIVNDIILDNGANTITVTAYDAANNTATDTLSVTYEVVAQAESCMRCHNGSDKNDYAQFGIANPHPFDGAQNIRCTVCHGGNGDEDGKEFAHVPAPPAIANLQPDPNEQFIDFKAYFNRLTLTGIDKQYDNYEVNGQTYSPLDYLQFINPGDLRVVSQGQSCGRCHGDNHVKWVMNSVLATEAGVLSGATYAAGIENAIPAHRNLYQDTAADVAFRAVSNPDYNPVTAPIGAVGSLNEFPVISQYNGQTNDGIPLVQGGQLNNYYNAANLANDLYQFAFPNDRENTNRVQANTALAALYHEQIAFTCGDCHLGSAGANNRYGDFRSSGCTACHMQYSPDGRSRSSDPNVNKTEPLNPDAINPFLLERPHIRRHVIQNVAKDLPNGNFVTGIEDMACAGCHQGSNRTVMQFWGIRLDQNQDIANGFQYPANPQDASNTAADTRLFDPAVGNNTFNGRNADQYIAEEDYDGDNRDDTPADIHHEAGMGCIDCHGSRDLHGGAPGDATGGQIMSRNDQVVMITCESCHGTVDAYINTTPCLNYQNVEAECAVDAAGNVLRHVNRQPNGDVRMKSRLTGNTHWVPQTRDTVVNNNKSLPGKGLVYSPKASYAMGRADGDVATGTGPIQANAQLYTNGFSHTDSMDCVSCHAAWTNSCIGCHLAGEFDNNPANYRFSNITGDRIAYNEQAADFTYISPIPFTLGVSSENMITQMSPAEKVFYRFFDGNNESQVFVFSDRNGNGNNPFKVGANAFPASSHNVMMPHSIRGKVGADTEGPRYCVACHLNTDSINNFGADYAQFFDDMANNNFANLDFNLLQEHIGQNPGNALNSPYFVHMAAGLGTGLFLFDETGCPVNPLDNNANRHYCPDGAPADNFDPNNVVYNLDRIVEATGVSNASSNHPMKKPGQGEVKRGGALNQNLSGPLGGQLIQKLADPNAGLILDSWIDADGAPQGNAAQFIQ